MSKRIQGGLLVAVLAALAQAPAFALSNTTVTSPLTRGVEAPPAAIQHADGLYTSGGSAMMLATPNYRAQVAAPEAMAREFLDARHAQLGLSATEQATLVRTSQRIGEHFSVVRFSQRIGGVPVYGSDIAVSVTPDGRVIYVSNATVPGATAVNAVARTSSADALGIGAQYLGIATARHQKAERMIHVANGVSRLVWRLELVAEDGPRGDWELLVDASTGTVLRAEDKAAYDDGNGTIWTPDPLSENLATYGDTGYVDGNNADTTQLTAALVPVTLEGITNTGGTFTLAGSYAVCQDFDTPHDAGCPSQASSDFSVTRSALTFDAVMGYYHITRYLKYVNETLGITALPLNHPGGVHYDPHGFDGADNSQYSSGGENLTFGAGGVDDAQDADVIIHELGHGIHDWITNGNLSQVEGLSEGVGDYNAGSYSRDFPGQWAPPDAPYFWTFSWDGHNPFWPGRVTNYELNHTYAQARNQEIHTAGQYWASCNLLVRDVVGGEVMDKAYFQGLSMTGASTNQQAAAQAVINAAAALGYSAGQIQAFADAYNSGNAGGHAGCSYNVTVPDVGGPVVVVDTTPLTGTATEGGSADTSFTVGNTGDAALDWNVDTSDDAACTTPATTPWITFAPTSGSIASGAADTTVGVTMDAAALTAGEYTTFACVHSNDAGTPVVAIPVTFTVTADDTIFADGFDG
jgi:Zn-dependent metalloprotease